MTNREGMTYGLSAWAASGSGCHNDAAQYSPDRFRSARPAGKHRHEAQGRLAAVIGVKWSHDNYRAPAILPDFPGFPGQLNNPDSAEWRLLKGNLP